MRVKEVQEILEAEVLSGSSYLDYKVDFGYGCDLMSDVLAFVKNNVILLTGLMHQQVIRTCEMLDIKAIVIVRGKTPSEELISLADEKGMILLTTKHSLYSACSLLYSKGLMGEEIAHEIKF